MNFKKQQKFRRLPMELYFGIFKAINTVPVKISNKPNKRITIKQWNKYIHKLLLSSRIVYIANKETFYKTKIELQHFKRRMERYLALEERSRKLDGCINKLNIQMDSIEKNIYFERMANTNIPNKWELTSCCENNCVFYEDYSGICNSGKDYVKVAITTEFNSIDYYYSEDENKANQKGVVIHAVHSFSIIQLHQYNYSFFFEATFFKLSTKIGRLPNEVGIGFTNKQGLEVALWIDKETKFTSCTINSKLDGTIKLKKVGDFCEFDNFGAGIRSLKNGRAYIYFTKNATNIGKYILLSDVTINFVPYVSLRSCSVMKTKFQTNVLPNDDPSDSDFYSQSDWK